MLNLAVIKNVWDTLDYIHFDIQTVLFGALKFWFYKSKIWLHTFKNASVIVFEVIFHIFTCH